MKKDMSRFVLFVSLAFSFLVVFLIFEYFMFVEVQIDFEIPLGFDHQRMYLFVDGKKFQIDTEGKRLFLRLRKGKHSFKVSIQDVIVLERNIETKIESEKIELKIPEPPRIQNTNCKFIPNEGKIKITWKTNIESDFYEVFKDGIKIARVKENSFQEKYNPFETHRYEIIPFYKDGKLKGIGRKIQVGPFVSLSNLKIRLVPPYDVSKDDLRLEINGEKVDLNDTLLAEITNIPTRICDVKVTVEGYLVLEKKIKLAPGDNEEIVELPDLPVLDTATAIVKGSKINISWIDPSNEFYKVNHYELSYSFDSTEISLSTKSKDIELPTSVSSEIRYSITPVFLKDLKGEPYEFIKHKKPSICLNYIPKSASSSELIIPLKTCEGEENVLFFYSLDGGIFKRVNDETLKLHLKDGVHTLRLKAIDSFYQEDDTTSTILIDTTPPERPKDLRISVNGNIMRVSWAEPESTDVIKCMVNVGKDSQIIDGKINEILHDISDLPSTLTVLVRFLDRVGNISETSTTVLIPRVPKLTHSTITYFGDGNDVNVELGFENYSGDLFLQLDSMEILHTTDTGVSLRLQNLDYDKKYNLNAFLKNDFGYSTLEKLLSFKTKLPKPKILDWKYEDGKLILKIEAVGSDFLYEITSGPYSKKISTDSTCVSIPIPKDTTGSYLLKVKARTKNNESFETMKIIEIGKEGS